MSARFGFLIVGLWAAVGIAKSEMVLNSSIGNDPAKERLCAERLKAIVAKPVLVPFYIDTRYLALSRSNNPDATFIAIDKGMLVECSLSSGSGRFEPVLSGEGWFFRVVKPKQFQPGINTSAGSTMAGDACREAARIKINRPRFDHSVVTGTPKEIIGRSGGSVGGKTEQSYDIVVWGEAFYKATGPDLSGVKFTCLFSPMLELKAVQLH